MANEAPHVEPDDAAAQGTGTGLATSDDTVEAVRAVIQAAIDVGRQVLDVVERTLRDPATAEKLGELLAGVAGAAEGLLPAMGAKGARPGPPPVEHITIDDRRIDDGLAPDEAAS
ncbi:MAG TPA: hypothetical protein VID93_10050 [Acidimicrobiales bacterium]